MIQRLQSDVRILILSGLEEPRQVAAWRPCDVDGYVPKSAAPDDVRAAVQALESGATWIPAALREELTGSRHPAAEHEHLSPREAELLPLLARGMTLREAAREMAISYKTADCYRTSLLRKLRVRDRVGLVLYAIRERIISA